MTNIVENFGENSQRLIDGFDVEDIQPVSSTLSRCTFNGGQDGLLKFEVMHDTNPLYAVLMALSFAAVNAGLPLYAYDIFPLRTETQQHGIVLASLFYIPNGMSLSFGKDLSRTSGSMTGRELVNSVHMFLTLMCDKNLNPNTIQSSSYGFLYNNYTDEISMILLYSCKAQTQKRCSQTTLNELKRRFSERLPQMNSFLNMMQSVKQSQYVLNLREQTDYVEQNFDKLPDALQPIKYV